MTTMAIWTCISSAAESRPPQTSSTPTTAMAPSRRSPSAAPPRCPTAHAPAAWADYDNNGFPDLLVTGRDGFSDVLYRNHGNGNHWISFKLIGTRSNRSAIGAKVRVQATIFGKTYWQMREVGTGNIAQNDLRPHFGLGDALPAPPPSASNGPPARSRSSRTSRGTNSTPSSSPRCVAR
jgi:hypothetical protein